jgi:endonuclease/exonuclease/phosphatase (EEP) superfamily protein YafD
VRTRRRIATIAAASGVVAGWAVLAAREVAWSGRLGMSIGAAFPYLVVVPGAAAVLAVVGRNKWIAAAAIATVIGFGATQLPLYVGGPGVAGPDAPLRVLTSNMRYGRADADELVRLVRERDVDVLAVQEITADASRRLEAAGLSELLPYALLKPEPGAQGTGIFSRYPLDQLLVPGAYNNPPTAATVHFASGGQTVDVVFASVHPRSPLPTYTPVWSNELEHMAAWADSIDGPVILAGDFNATNDHAQMREFFDRGYLDGAARAGGGYLATFPSDSRLPPLIAIDHVLTRGGPVTTDIASITVGGTDHRAVLATVALPVADQPPAARAVAGGRAPTSTTATA